MVLNEAFLDSEWGQHERDQALMQTLEDASVNLLVIVARQVLSDERASLVEGHIYARTSKLKKKTILCSSGSL